MQSQLRRLLLGLNADFGRRRRHEHFSNGCVDHCHFCRESLASRRAHRRLTDISFFGVAIVALICPKLFPGLNPCCPP
jgi:hypothetical protein